MLMLACKKNSIQQSAVSLVCCWNMQSSLKAGRRTAGQTEEFIGQQTDQHVAL